MMCYRLTARKKVHLLNPERGVQVKGDDFRKKNVSHNTAHTVPQKPAIKSYSEIQGIRYQSLKRANREGRERERERERGVNYTVCL
jgi:hypothetical protein